MSDPPPRDDPSIPDSEYLYRGIHPDHLEEGVVKSMAFKASKKNPHVSVDRASLTTPEDSLKRRPATNVGMVQLLTSVARMHAVGVASEPVEADPVNDIEANPAHAIIIHDVSIGPSALREIAREFAKACTWVIPR